MNSFLRVARLVRPHGLSGEISADILTDFPERFVPGSRLIWQRGAEEQTLTLSSARAHGRRWLFGFEGVSDVEGARSLCGGDLGVTEAAAFPAPDGFFYSHEIRGWRCEDLRGEPLGEAAELEATPAGPMLSVDTGGGKIALVPFVHGIVVRVDRDARKI